MFKKNKGNLFPYIIKKKKMFNKKVKIFFLTI